MSAAKKLSLELESEIQRLEESLSSKVFVIANDFNRFLRIVEFLKKNSVDATLVQNVDSQLSEIIRKEGTILFLSWNFKTLNVLGVYKVFLSKSESNCVVFSEEDSIKSRATLASSGITETIQPPFTERNFLRIVQKIENDRKELIEKLKRKLRHENRQEARKNNKEEEGLIKTPDVTLVQKGPKHGGVSATVGESEKSQLKEKLNDVINSNNHESSSKEYIKTKDNYSEVDSNISVNEKQDPIEFRKELNAKMGAKSDSTFLNSPLDLNEKKTKVDGRVNSENDSFSVNCQIDNESEKKHLDAKIDSKKNVNFLNSKVKKESDQTHLDAKIDLTTDLTHLDAKIENNEDLNLVHSKQVKDNEINHVDSEIDLSVDFSMLNEEINVSNEMNHIDGKVNRNKKSEHVHHKVNSETLPFVTGLDKVMNGGNKLNREIDKIDLKGEGELNKKSLAKSELDINISKESIQNFDSSIDKYISLSNLNDLDPDSSSVSLELNNDKLEPELDESLYVSDSETKFLENSEYFSEKEVKLILIATGIGSTLCFAFLYFILFH